MDTATRIKAETLVLLRMGVLSKSVWCLVSDASCVAEHFRTLLARQTKALRHLGCALIYSDAASGKSMAGRPQLGALDDLGTDAELVIAERDGATRLCGTARRSSRP